MPVDGQKQMILWTLVLLLGLTVLGGAVMLNPPTSNENQFASAKYLRVSQLKRLKANGKTGSPSVSSGIPIAQKNTGTPSIDLGHLPGTVSEERHPASSASSNSNEDLNGGQTLQTDQLASSLDISLGCISEKPTRFKNSVAQIRLSGKICEPNAEIVSTEVRNMSNGASATLFHPQSNTFTTDYLALSVGLNKIRLLHLLKNGSREEREYVFERSPASNKEL